MDNINIITEDFNKCELKISLLQDNVNILKILSDLKQIIPQDRDSILIKIYSEYRSIDLITDIKLQEEKKLLDEEDEKSIVIIISKLIKESVLSIYSLEKFTECLEKRNLQDLLYNFSEKSNVGQLVFQLLNDKVEFYSRKYIFSSSPNIKKVSLKEENEKIKIFERNELCNINSTKTIDVLPYDFYLIKRTNSTLMIENIFDKLTLLLSFIAISNYSSFIGNILKYSINGYNNIKNEINFENIFFNSIDTKKIYKIFEWIYKDNENILERLEISRNIMSLYYVDNESLKTNNDVLNSIKSSYSLYLKKNIDRYMKIIKESQDLLNELEKNFYILESDFNSKFKKDIGAVFTFLISTVLFNTLATGEIQNIFTRDISIITVALLIIFMIFFGYESFKLKINMEKIEHNYEEKKKIFYVVLGQKEVEGIFKEIEILKKNKQELIRTKKENIIIFFVIFIIIFTTLYFLSDWLRYSVVYKIINYFKCG